MVFRLQCLAESLPPQRTQVSRDGELNSCEITRISVGWYYDVLRLSQQVIDFLPVIPQMLLPCHKDDWIVAGEKGSDLFKIEKHVVEPPDSGTHNGASEVGTITGFHDGVVKWIIKFCGVIAQVFHKGFQSWKATICDCFCFFVHVCQGVTTSQPIVEMFIHKCRYKPVETKHNTSLILSDSVLELVVVDIRTKILRLTDQKGPCQSGYKMNEVLAKSNQSQELPVEIK